MLTYDVPDSASYLLNKASGMEVTMQKMYCHFSIMFLA